MAKKINYKSLLAQEQKTFFAEIKRMPKFTTKSTVNQAIKLEDWIKLHKTIINSHLQNLTSYAYNFWLQSIGQSDLISEKKPARMTNKARPGTKPVRRAKSKTLSERKNVVVFPDGFEFKKVSTAYAKKNFNNEMIYGLDPIKGIESLIEDISDFNYWKNNTNIFGKEY